MPRGQPMHGGFARSRDFWVVSGRAAFVGAAAGVATLVFLGAEHALHDLLWPTREDQAGWFSTPLRGVVVMLCAAVLVGWWRRASGLRPPDPNFLDELTHGRSEPRHAAHLVGIGLVSLVGGASVGPEAPIATAGAGVGTGVAERWSRPGARDDTPDLTMAGISGVFGAVLTFPFAAPLIALELQEDRDLGRYERLVPALIAATVGLAVVFPVLGAPFVDLYDQPIGGTPRLWYLGAAVPLGLVGAGVALLLAVVTGLVGAVAARVVEPVTRAVVGGVVLAVIGWALPLTLFSGREELALVLEEGVAATGVAFLVATIVGKVITFSVSMRAGFFGGALFPLLFVGAVTGALVHEVVPAMPQALVVTSVAGAVTVSMVGLPLTTLAFVLILFALGVVASAVPAVAIVTAYVVVHGTGLLDRVAGWLAGTR